MDLYEQCEALEVEDRENDLRAYAALINRSERGSRDDARAMRDIRRRIGMDKSVFREDVDQHKRAVAAAEEIRRRRESFASLASEFLHRDHSRTFPRSIEEQCINGAEKLMLQLTLGGDDRPLKMDTDSVWMELHQSLGHSKPGKSWLDRAGIPVVTQLLISDQFRSAYEPLIKPCKASLAVPSFRAVPDDPSDEEIESLRREVDAMDLVDIEMTGWADLIVGGYLLFIAPISGPDRLDVQKRVVEQITRIHGDLLTRIRSRRGIGV